MMLTFLCMLAVGFAPVCFGAAVADGCPPDKPMVYCFVSPCATVLCGPGTTCVADYCGGCSASCEKVQCLRVLCPAQVACLNGYKKDKNGCDTCECDNLICPLRKCSGSCPNGFKQDKNGCNTCECNECPPVLCDLFCATGFKKGKNGCDICECNDQACENVVCQITEKCENGACVPKGCLPGQPVALCKTLPCATVKCAAGTVCVNNYCGGCSASCEAGCYHGGKMYATGVSFPAGDGCNTCSCSGANVICTLIACEEPTPKPGTCPKADSGLITTCDVRCESDAECPGKEKCCSWECSIRCLAPVDDTTVCKYGVQTYKPGDSFPASDGCNTCTCSKDGSVGCTEIYCGCPQYRCKACSTGHKKDENGCDTCECIDPKCEGVQCPKGGNCKNGVCCPLNKPYVNCLANPCATRRCGWWRRCRANYCGGCNSRCVWAK